MGRSTVPTKGQPVSLVNPKGTKAERRAFFMSAGNGPPSGVPEEFQADPNGPIHTRNHRFLHAVFKLDLGTVDYRVHTYREFAEEWVVDTRPGDATGLVSLSAGNDDLILEIAGSSFVYIEFLNFAGGGQIEAWLGACSF